MNSTSLRRVSTGVGWGAFIVLAWVALTLFASPGAAHADDDQDAPLDGVTSLIGSTVGAGSELVSGVVDKTVPAAVETVAPVVTETFPAVAAPVTKTVAQTAAAIPVVRDVVAPVVAPVAQEATQTVAGATVPVTDLLQGSPVVHVTEPVLDVVADVPVVGDLVADLGVPHAVADVTGAVDSTTAAVGRTVGNAVPPILDAVEAVIPPASPAPGVNPDSEDAAESPVVDLPPRADAVTHEPRGAASAALLSSSPTFGDRHMTATVWRSTSAVGPDTAGAPVGTPGPAHAPPGAPGPSPSSSAGSGGGAIGDAARPSDAFADALHAWSRAFSDIGDDMPCSPVAETDTSPD